MATMTPATASGSVLPQTTLKPSTSLVPLLVSMTKATPSSGTMGAA